MCYEVDAKNLPIPVYFILPVYFKLLDLDTFFKIMGEKIRLKRLAEMEV